MIGSHLSEVARVVKYREKIKWWLPSSAGGGSWCLMGAEFEFGKMKKVLDMDGDDRYTTIYKRLCH